MSDVFHRDDQELISPFFDALLALREGVSQNKKDLFFSFIRACAERFAISHSQLFQDLFVLYLLEDKKRGFFVEFGATDGIGLSNSYLLEREFNWKGILAEPGRCWHRKIKSNRKATIDFRCVWSQSGQILSFSETDYAELSTISTFANDDFNANARVGAKIYEVETVSLNDLLKNHNAPKIIDYMSIDTEGSELDILLGFNFTNYDIKILTIEHNNVEPNRERIRSLLASNGFSRIFTSFSKWDDWYVKTSLLRERGFILA